MAQRGSLLSTENRLLNVSIAKKPETERITERTQKTVKPKEDLKTHLPNTSATRGVYENFQDWFAHQDALSHDESVEFSLPEIETNKSADIKDVRGNVSAEADLLKENLIILVSGTIVPSLSFKNKAIRKTAMEMLDELSKSDPEFVLKVVNNIAQELNIRFTTNFLLAYAAANEACRPYIGKYFSSSINLPSDWMEVVQTYELVQDPSAKRGSLPQALRKAMKSKFKEFDQYQLAKYNRELKGETKPAKNASDTKRERNESASSSGDEAEPVHKRPLTLKNLIRQLHISEPKDNVLCLLGKRYPSSAQEFLQCGLSGEWQPELVGTKMKLPVPYTWETELSKTPIKSQKEAWERLIDSRKLPYMALMRNLRNLLLVGIGSDQKTQAIKHLTNKGAVSSSKQMPFRYFAAYSALSSVVAVTRKQAIKQERLKNVNMAELKEYTQAVETAFEIAVRNNLPVVQGSTLIVIDLKEIPSESVSSFGLLSNSPVALKLLLGFMCMTACEHFEAYISVQGKLFNTCHFRKLLPREGEMLKTVKKAEQLLKVCQPLLTPYPLCFDRFLANS
ncbi:unnamed protein product [Dibothriocephalus latus]|uniref:TROVE domain-containing protein n=1 Tax=Dibothriocephalus latus TaxID=60516 RepID=A0A3P7L4B1_DIBLA|nr:unnamed protein product [Dibothriocephalus latus]